METNEGKGKKSIIFIDGVRLSGDEQNEAKKIVSDGVVIGKVFIKEKEQQKLIGYFTPKLEDFKNNSLWSIEPLSLLDEFKENEYEINNILCLIRDKGYCKESRKLLKIS